MTLPTRWTWSGRYPSAPQVLDRVGRRREQVVAHPIGDDTIDLLGHGPVAAPQPGFDVRDERTGLRRDDGTGERRIHIADDHDHVGAERSQQRFEGGHHPGGLFRMRARADTEVLVGFADVELFEEDLTHSVVVVLTRVHEHRLHAGVVERHQHRRDLHEVRSRARDTHYAHGALSCRGSGSSCASGTGASPRSMSMMTSAITATTASDTTRSIAATTASDTTRSIAATTVDTAAERPTAGPTAELSSSRRPSPVGKTPAALAVIAVAASVALCASDPPNPIARRTS
jgi:hypothetical protein